MAYEWRRVAPDDPNRCQGIGGQGQCPYGAVPDSKYCPRHGGNKGQQAAQAESKRLYLLTKWREKLDFHADHPKAKKVNEELGVLRMVLERKLEGIKDDQELVMQSGSITQMVGEIGRLAKLSVQLDKMTSESLDRSQAQAWVNKVINIIAIYMPDPELLQLASEDMMLAFDEVQHASAMQIQGI